MENGNLETYLAQKGGFLKLLATADKKEIAELKRLMSEDGGKQKGEKSNG
jgi:hypothetical protein